VIRLNDFAKKPMIGPWEIKAIDFAMKSEVNSIATHFSSYLMPVVASEGASLDASFNIRHKVYCEELNFEEQTPEKMESDDFDQYSIHCLIKHIPSSRYSGTIRIVRPQKAGEIIPIQKYCLNAISPGKINPNDFEPHDICELSRLAVPNEFRRRQSDKNTGSAIGVMNQNSYSEKELRCFPFIAIGLYLSAASVVMEKGIKHTFVMMEPSLARNLRFVGINFEQIGPVVDYHGKRAPYYINRTLLMETLTPGFQKMLKDIQKTLKYL
jgi:N-acyl amino acid synthase of PEP-CTERM/exosortase system